MSHWIRKIDGMEHYELLHIMNGFEPEIFPPLQSRHLVHGHWWIAQEEVTNIAVGFAGLVEMTPFDGVGYLKRAYVLPQYRGQGMHSQFLRVREQAARDLGWHLVVSECANRNVASAKNFTRAGYLQCDPEQPWETGAIYFSKRL